MMPFAYTIRALFIAIFTLIMVNGFLSTLIAIRLELAGASAGIIGLVATSYFAGLMLGSLRLEKFITRIGHIRAFAAYVTVYSASSLTYAILDHPSVWTALRFIDGFPMAGVFVCLESWLNQQASPRNRSAVLAFYMIALYCGQAAGQFLLNLGDNAPDLPFMVSAILLSIALLPILLTRMEQPEIETVAPFSLRRLYEASPLGIVGTLITGAMLGAFYALGAVYIQRIGMGLSQVALFTSCVIAGGVALQYPLGLLSDRFDRRLIVNVCFLAAAAVCAAIALLPLGSTGAIVLGSLFGGFAFALYPSCVAHSTITLPQRNGYPPAVVASSSIRQERWPARSSVRPGWERSVLRDSSSSSELLPHGAAPSVSGEWQCARPFQKSCSKTLKACPEPLPMVAVLEVEDEN